MHVRQSPAWHNDWCSNEKPGKEKAGSISRAQAEQIAKDKMEDLNTDDLEMAVRIVAGAARSMGVEVTS